MEPGAQRPVPPAAQHMGLGPLGGGGRSLKSNCGLAIGGQAAGAAHGASGQMQSRSRGLSGVGPGLLCVYSSTVHIRAMQFGKVQGGRRAPCEGGDVRVCALWPQWRAGQSTVFDDALQAWVHGGRSASSEPVADAETKVGGEKSGDGIINYWTDGPSIMWNADRTQEEPRGARRTPRSGGARTPVLVSFRFVLFHF